VATTKRRQPKGLYVLFLTEMWERFGFYTLYGLFVLYLTKDLGMGDAAATLLFGAFASYLYVTTLPGGHLADRVLGFRRAIILGAAIMCVGYLSLTIGEADLVPVSLGILIVGNGFFKPNVGALLGHLYDDDDPRRESGFTIFYLGINLGSFVAFLIAGWIAQEVGYNWAFGMAGIGKLISMATFILGRRWLGDAGYAPDPQLLRERHFGLPLMWVVMIGCIGAAGVATYLMNHDVAAGGVLAVAAIVAFAFFLYEGWQEDRAIRRRIVVLVVLSISAIVFWSVYVQVGSSFLLFVDRSVDRDILGLTIPPSEFLSLNPLFILLMGMPFAALWLWLDRFRLNPSTPLKFVFGFILIGASYFILVWGIATSTDKVAWEWLILFFFVYTAAEMVLSPVGLAMTTDLAPKRLTGLAMGIWLLATSGGLYVGGVLASVAAVPKGTSAPATRDIYESSFADFGWIALATGLLLFALVPWLKRLMRKQGSEADAAPSR